MNLAYVEENESFRLLREIFNGKDMIEEGKLCSWAWHNGINP